MTSSSTIPSVATEGFKDASAYDAHRPSYPAEAVEALLKKLRVQGQSDTRIVEIASGTGKFTELLSNRPEQFLVKAIEPHDTMREKLAEKDLPAVEVVNGSASKMPVEEEWGDACIAAQVCCARTWNSTLQDCPLTGVLGVSLVSSTRRQTASVRTEFT